MYTYKINPLPPPPTQFYPIDGLVMCESKTCLSEFFKFLLHHIHILWFKKNERLKLLRIYYFFFFRKILSWIICYMCVCCNVKQYICARIFIRTLHSWNMYVCHSNAKYSHYINVRLFFCIFSGTIFFFGVLLLIFFFFVKVGISLFGSPFNLYVHRVYICRASTEGVLARVLILC